MSNGPVGFEQDVNVTGKIAPNGDSDWYRFFASDVAEGDTALDSWRVNIELVQNPSLKFFLRVYRGALDNPACPGF